MPVTPGSASRGAEGVREAAAILTARDGDFTAATLAEYLDVTTRTAQRHIRRMLDGGSVMERDGRAHHYVTV